MLARRLIGRAMGFQKVFELGGILVADGDLTPTGGQIQKFIFCRLVGFNRGQPLSFRRARQARLNELGEGLRHI